VAPAAVAATAVAALLASGATKYAARLVEEGVLVHRRTAHEAPNGPPPHGLAV
jgi:hypothetical protein